MAPWPTLNTPEFIGANIELKFVEPEYIVPPDIVVADKLGAITAPVNVAPLKFAFVLICDLSELKNTFKSVKPEYIVPPEIVVAENEDAFAVVSCVFSFV